MKKVLIITFLALACMCGTSLETQAQVVVAVKPARPDVVVVKPAKARRGYIWVDGHWKYNKRTNRYVWVKGGWVRARRGFVYVPGRWVKAPAGFKWVPGTWRRV